MENVGREPSVVHTTIHGSVYSGSKGISGAHRLLQEVRFSNDYHLCAAEWTANEIPRFVDEQIYFSVTPDRLPAGAEWVFDRSCFLVLNLATGGNWPGQPDETTSFPQVMCVDDVRVYAASSSP